MRYNGTSQKAADSTGFRVPDSDPSSSLRAAPAADLPAARPLPRERPSPARGVLFMALSALTISLMHVGVRYVSAELHPFVIGFFRNALVLVLIAPIILRGGADAWRTRRPALQGLRGVIGVVAMLMWFWSLSVVPIAEATALSFTTAIFVTIGAAVFLREHVGPRRWTAVAFGFLGALIILRPGFQDVTLGAVFAALSSAIFALSLLVLKVLAQHDRSITNVFYSALLIAPMSLVPALFVWEWPTWHTLLVLFGMSACAAVAQFSMSQSFRYADASLTFPIDFTRLIWASVIGAILFGEIPDVWTWVGGTVIFASAAFISFREARLARRARESQG